MKSIYILEANGRTNTAKYVGNIVSDNVKVFTSRDSIYLSVIEIPVFGGYRLASNAIAKLFHYIKGLCLILMSINRGSILHYHWLKFSPLDMLFLLALKLKGIKLVGTVHNILPHENKVWDRFFYRKIYALTDVLVFHSKGIYEKFNRLFDRTKRHQIISHYLDEVSVDRQLENPRHLLFFGNIRPYKGLELLLKAINLMPLGLEWKLTIAGNPEYNIDDLIESCQENSNITWVTRFVSNEEVGQLFNSCGIVVMPYLKIDTSGLLYLAKSYEKVIVAPNMGIFQEEIISEKNGLLFEPENEKDLSRTIEMALNPSVFHELGFAIKNIMPKDSVNSFKEQHKKLYQGIL